MCNNIKKYLKLKNKKQESNENKKFWFKVKRVAWEKNNPSSKDKESSQNQGLRTKI